MKKLILIIISLAFLCSCTETPPKEPDNKNSSQSSQSESVSQSEPEVSQEQNKTSEPTDPEESGKSEEPEFEFLFETEGVEVYKKRVETTGTMSQLVFGKDGVPNSIIDVPEVEYWITDSDGNKLIEHPFYYFYWSTEYGFYDVDNQYPEIRGIYKGTLYRYYIINGKISLDRCWGADSDSYFDVVEDNKGNKYLITEYYYPCLRYGNDFGSCYEYGLSDMDGNVIVEPISDRYIKVPFEDRYLIMTGDAGDVGDAFECCYTMIDSDGNILCSFSDIVFYHFDDGTYIGMAYYYGYGHNKTGTWGHILKNENGEIYEVGFRFIDKDGNVLSPCFNSVYLEMGMDTFLNSHLDEVITATDKNGKTVTFTARDYICKE